MADRPKPPPVYIRRGGGDHGPVPLIAVFAVLLLLALALIKG